MCEAHRALYELTIIIIINKHHYSHLIYFIMVASDIPVDNLNPYNAELIFKIMETKGF